MQQIKRAIQDLLTKNNYGRKAINIGPISVDVGHVDDALVIDVSASGLITDLEGHRTNYPVTIELFGATIGLGWMTIDRDGDIIRRYGLSHDVIGEWIWSN